MSEAISAIGTKFYRWSTSSTEWKQLAEVVSIGGPSGSRETIDVTSLDSVNGYKEKISGLRDAGNVSLTLNFRRDTYDLLKADFEDDDAQNYKIVLPDEDETTYAFMGLVTELPPAFEVSGAITVDCTIEISGAVDVYDGSSGA